MKLKRLVTKVLATAMIVTTLAPLGTPETVSAAPTNLVPSEPLKNTPNYACTWNIQDWVAYHENKDKRDIVDPKHLFDEKTGWITTMYPTCRQDMLFLLDDGWDLPYGTKKGGKNQEYFGCQVLPDDKFPKKEWGDTPQEKLKTLNEKIKKEGWAGTGIWICAQRSTAYNEYKGKDEEDFWRMRLRWSKYAGIAYWKIDWGTEQKKIEWRRKISEWAEEEYPELIIEHVVGGSGQNENDGRMKEDLLFDNVEFAAFADVFRTYDVLDPLMTSLTLDRVGEQLIAGHTEKGNALGIMNAEDELYICASLGLSTGVMRHTPYLTTDKNNSGDAYFGLGTEKDTYFAGGKRWVDTRATRKSLDEVARALRWQRIAPPYTVGDYDTKLANQYLTDDWTFTPKEQGWDKTGKDKDTKKSFKAPAAIARGIDLPTVKVSKGEIPFLTASRNPNGAISIATYCRTFSSSGYTPNKTAEVSLEAGDLTGKIGVFGYYGKLNLTFNQSLEGKKVYAQDLLADKVEDITSKVKIDGKKITIEGSVIDDIGLDKATRDDRSQPGLVIQIGEEADFKEAPKTNERLERWGVNNGSFENFHYDSAKKQTIQSVTAADWQRSGDIDASYINEGGNSGKYSGIHKRSSDYEVTTYHMNKSVASGTYKASCYVKTSGITRSGSKRGTSAGLFVTDGSNTLASVDIAKLGKLDDWTYVEIPRFQFGGGNLQVELYTYGKKNEYLMFDDVKIEKFGAGMAVADPSPIVKFDFSKASSDKVYGIANGKEITATAQNVTFKTDEDGNAVAVFPSGGSNVNTGITYDPGNADPLKQLKSGNGATVSVWMKSTRDNFSSPLVCYGALRGNGNLGASMDIHLRNNVGGDVMYYRNQEGNTDGHKVTAIGNPYKKDTWQLVTYVEEWDGTGTFYVDGIKKGTCKSSDKTLLGYATDGNSPDKYYIGYLPYETENDTHFEGSIDSVTIYDCAMGESQVKELYEERTGEQTSIELKADGDGLVTGKAADEFKKGQGYVSWMGKDDGFDEGTVTFNFTVKNAGEWNMDVAYLSEQERDFVITVNDDAENAITTKCPAGASWNDVSKAATISVQKVTLKKGDNTIKIGNANGTAPSLVKVTLIRADLAAAKEVEEYIMGSLGTVDDFAMLGMVCNARAKYDALTKEQQAMVSKEAYDLLITAESFMNNGINDDDRNQSQAVKDAIDAIGEVTLEKEDKIKAAREAYDKLGETPKKMVTDDYVEKLTDAEKKLEELKKDPGDPPVDKVDPPAPDSENTYQAEDAAFTEACVISESTSCSNGKFVGELGGDKGGKVTFTVNAESAGKYDLDIYYITHYDRDFEVTVNNGTATTVACPGNNTDWNTTVAKVTVSVELEAGVNKIALGNTKDYAPNLDMIALTLKEASTSGEEINKEEQELATAKVALETAIEAAESYKEENYTEESWAEFADALDAAKAALENEEAKAEDLNNAKSALTDALNALAKVEDNSEELEEAKAALNRVVAAADKVRASGSDKYTAESWAVFDKAYANATNPTAIAVATVDELKALTDALTNAQAELEVKSDEEVPPVENPDNGLETAKKSLEAALEAASKIVESGNEDGTYTESSWSVFVDAYENAKDRDADATATQLDTLTKRLEAAQKALKNATEPDGSDEEVENEKQQLDVAVKAVENIIHAGQGDFTTDSWNTFVKAYEAAKNLKEDATAEEVKARRADLKAAQDGLRKKVPGGSGQIPNQTQPQTSYIDQVSVTSDEDTLYIGGNTGKTAVINVKLPTGAASKSVTYSTSDAKVAKVDTAGQISATGKGTATITANVTLTNGETKTFNLSVTVKKAYIEKVSVKSSYKVGKKATLKAKAYGSTKKITWKIKSGSKYAGITKTGKLTTKAKGKVKVVAKSGKISKTFTIRVK